MATEARRRWGRRRAAAGPTAGERAAGAAGSGMLMLARLVRLAAIVAFLLIVAGILLIVFKANPTNDIVSHITDWARTIVGPFKNLFSIHKPRVKVAVNWGIAAVVYLIVGSLIARFIARGARAAY